MMEARSDGNTGLPAPLRRAVWVFSCLYVVCLVAEIVSRLRHLGLPYVWPLMSYYSAFTDFTFFAPHAATFHSKAFFNTLLNYPATLACMLEGWYLLPWPLATYLCSVMASFVGAGGLFRRALLGAGVSTRGVVVLLTAFAVSFPLWFEFERANAEAMVWLVVSLGIWAFLQERPYTAGMCFGFAGTMKIFPLVFFGLLIARKQYKQVVIGGTIALCVLVVALWMESGSVLGSWYGTASAAEPFWNEYLIKVDSSGFDHSLFALIKQMFAGHHRDPGLAAIFAMMLRRYMVLAGVVGVVLYFARIKKMPVLNQILLLTVASIVLPPVSFDYTLIYLYVPCAMLILVILRTDKNGGVPAGAGAALLAMAVALSPETEVIAQRVSLGGDIKCVTLLVLFGIALRYRFEEALNGSSVAAV